MTHCRKAHKPLDPITLVTMAMMSSIKMGLPLVYAKRGYGMVP